MSITGSSGKLDRQHIRSRVVEILFETRGRDRDDYFDSARLFDDLSFESIDFLEIDFQFSEAFGFADPGFPTDEVGYMMNDGLTPDSGSTLSIEEATAFAERFERSFMMRLPDDIEKSLSTETPADLRQPITDCFTVAFMVDYVYARLQQKRGAA